jgi:hypothetical protein
VNIKSGHRVRLLRDISRAEGPYAQAGEAGTVTETFRPPGTSSGTLGPWCAKVRMDGTGVIKTFRLTSLERETP